MYKKSRFWGTLDNLKYFVSQSRVCGRWWTPYSNMHQFNPTNGGCLIWWPSKRTMVMQGNWTEDDATALLSVVNFGPYKPAPVEVPDVSDHVGSSLVDLNEVEEYFVIPDLTPYVDALMADIR